jgi:hypothetical protein
MGVFCYFVGLFDDVEMIGPNSEYDCFSVEVNVVFCLLSVQLPLITGSPVSCL